MTPKMPVVIVFVGLLMVGIIASAIPCLPNLPNNLSNLLSSLAANMVSAALIFLVVNWYWDQRVKDSERQGSIRAQLYSLMSDPYWETVQYISDLNTSDYSEANLQAMFPPDANFTKDLEYSVI